MKDHETLETHNIKDGMTVHLVIRSGGTSGGSSNQSSAQQNPPQQPQSNPSQTPFGLGGIGGLPGMSNLGLGSANFMEMQQRMQEGIMNNPDFMRQIMDSPLTQSLMSNPEIVRGLVQSNPQMRQLIGKDQRFNSFSFAKAKNRGKNLSKLKGEKIRESLFTFNMTIFFTKNIQNSELT